jgi:AraC family transcriptional regulator, arabinose operon regulatory protein
VDRRVCKTCDILAMSWNKRVALAELSKNVGLSSSRLEHLFKMEVGVSIREYVLRHRLQAAAHLLAATDLRIKEICYRVGFGDFSGFDHLFKRTFGIAPSDYRSGFPNL